MADQIKCGRKVFDLVKGDRVIENGFYCHLLSRPTMNGYPMVSKAEFRKFMIMNVKPLVHYEDRSVTIWEYQGESND